MSKSELEESLLLQYRAFELPLPEREHRFKPGRRWSLDFAWPGQRVAVEVEGGVWSEGRHTRGKGFIDDCNKYNEATVMGWKIIRVTSEHIDNGKALEWTRVALGELAPF